MITNRFTPYSFYNSKITKNRVIIPPMASQTANKNGFVTPATIEHYKNLAQSDAGLIFVEYSFIHKSGKGEENQLGADSDEKIEGLKKVVSVIHQQKALAGLQIVHAGGKTSSEITAVELIGASAIAVPIKGSNLEKPTPLLKANIAKYIQWYVDAASRAQQAGFDFVELHAAHGYGLNQWLSPLTNQRDDEFGGPISNRAKILLTISQRIKEEIPSLLLAVRLPARDYLTGGLSLADMSYVTQKLEKIGVDLIDVSSGIGGWKRPEGSSGEGYLVEDAMALKRNTSVPVIGVGGIESGSYIDEVLSLKKIDFAAVGRALLKDPLKWSQKNLIEKLDTFVCKAN
jgi:NADPH2 dehydrogenase